nr:MAG TPA: hypothetical protein [Caudoviricetes sp.]
MFIHNRFPIYKRIHHSFPIRHIPSLKATISIANMKIHYFLSSP